MKVLYTAFKGTNNTSFQLVSRLNLPSLFLTNSFEGLKKDISLQDERFDMVIMFGVDSSLSDQIRIETSALYNGDDIVSSFDLRQLERMCSENRVEYLVSDKPTGFLCNAAYYHMLKKNPNTVFIHIPSIKRMNDDFMKKLMFLKSFCVQKE